MVPFFRSNRYFFSFFLSLVILFGSFSYRGDAVFLHAQSSDSVTDRQKQLQAELDEILKEIDAQTAILNSEKQKGASLERDVAILNAQISKAQLNIKAHNIAIEGLGKDIGKKTETINELEARIEKNKESLSELMRKTNEIDQFSLAEVVLTKTNLSDFFLDVDSFNAIQGSLQVSVNEIKKNKSDTETQKEALDKKRLQEIDVKVSVEAEKRKIETAEAEKKRLLGLSKQQQQNYTAVLADRQRKAAAIRSALFALRDTAAIPFGKALEYANVASKATGVRPAFILAILTQESNLGQNVGACYLTDFTTGAGVRATTGAITASVMKPGRDIEPFLRITAGVGRDPKQTRVSCPFSVGYGGAMGPSQFIPSTWETYQSRIGNAVGKTTPDPWDPNDAIMATALFMYDLGAGTQSYSSERQAALRYYAGGNWALPQNAFYGDQVMAKTQSIQETMIDPLQGL